MACLVLRSRVGPENDQLVGYIRANRRRSILLAGNESAARNRKTRNEVSALASRNINARRFAKKWADARDATDDGDKKFPVRLCRVSMQTLKLWRPRRDLNPCYRRESIAPGRN